MARFDWAESAGSAQTETVRLHEATMGDGYVQRAPAGLNPIDESWQLNFKAVSRTAGDEIVAFFRTHQGATPFDWTPPFTTVSGKWVVKSWTRTALDDIDLSDITATFVRDYRP